MGRKVFGKNILILAVICFYFSGCQNSSVESPPTISLGEENTTTVTNSETPTPTFLTPTDVFTESFSSPESIVTINPTSTILPTPETSSETLATLTSHSQDYLVCETYKSFDLDNYLELEAIYDVQFIDENNIHVSMFLNGRDDSTPFRYEYSEGVLEIEAEVFSLEVQEPSPLLLNPCTGDCQYDVIDHSPDRKWQIVRTFEEDEEDNGFWLVSLEDKIQLVDYLPWNFRWEWTGDSSLLWFDYSLPEFGVVDIVVQLTSPPGFIELEPNEFNPLTTTYNDIALSPENLTILSTAADQRNVPNRDSDELYVFDFSQDMTEPVSSMTINGLDGVEWNEATNTFLLFLDIDRRIEIRDWEGSGTWSISDSYMPDSNLSGLAITVSPSGQRITTFYRNQLLVFGCG